MASKKITYPKCFQDGSYKETILPGLNSLDTFEKFVRKILYKTQKMNVSDAMEIVNKISVDVLQIKHSTIKTHEMYSFMVNLRNNLEKLEKASQQTSEEDSEVASTSEEGSDSGEESASEMESASYSETSGTSEINDSEYDDES